MHRLGHRPARVQRTLASLSLGVLATWLFTACTTTAAGLGTGCNDPLPELFERASPSVVMITGQSINPYRLPDRVNRSLASVFVIVGKRLILTNSHVVLGLESLGVPPYSGQIVPAAIITPGAI